LWTLKWVDRKKTSSKRGEPSGGEGNGRKKEGHFESARVSEFGCKVVGFGGELRGAAGGLAIIIEKVGSSWDGLWRGRPSYKTEWSG